MAMTRWLGPWRLNRTTGQWWRQRVVSYPPYAGGHVRQTVVHMTVTYFGPVVPPRVKRG